MPGGGSSSGGKCNYYNRTGNTTDPFSIRANYGGIPEEEWSTEEPRE